MVPLYGAADYFDPLDPFSLGDPPRRREDGSLFSFFETPSVNVFLPPSTFYF